MCVCVCVCVRVRACAFASQDNQGLMGFIYAFCSFMVLTPNELAAAHWTQNRLLSHAADIPLMDKKVTDVAPDDEQTTQPESWIM